MFMPTYKSDKAKLESISDARLSLNMSRYLVIKLAKKCNAYYEIGRLRRIDVNKILDCLGNGTVNLEE